MSLPPNSIDQSELDELDAQPRLPPFDARSYKVMLKRNTHMERENAVIFTIYISS